VQALTRTYFPKTQGTPIRSRFDPNTGDFASVFYYDPTVMQPSLLYMHVEQFYKEGSRMSAFFQKEKVVRVNHKKQSSVNYWQVYFTDAFNARESGLMMFTLTPTI